MSRQFVTGLVTCCLAVFVIVWYSVNEEPAIWVKTYDYTDDQPYGSELMLELLPHYMGEGNVQAVNKPVWEVLADTDLVQTNYVFLNTFVLFDDVEVRLLMEHVERGNTVFIAAEYTGDVLMDTLGIELNSSFGWDALEEEGAEEDDASYVEEVRETVKNAIPKNDTLRVNFLANDLARENGYFYEAIAGQDWSSAIQKQAGLPEKYPLTPLGVFMPSDTNFVMIEVGKGAFYINTAPLAFTNYNIVKSDNLEYVNVALSHLPAQQTFLDSYYKPFRKEIQSPLRFILSQPGLKAAYYVALGALLLFVFVHVRRKQRIIPPLVPKDNKTIEFAHTMGRLYMSQGDHGNLATKLLDQFKHYVSHQLQLPANQLAQLSVDKVAARSGVDKEVVQKLLGFLQQFEKQLPDKQVDADALQKLAIELDTFYTGTKR